jgi:hypothetical protein
LERQNNPLLFLKDVELARGIEPPTCGLQNRCSAVELRQRRYYGRLEPSTWPGETKEHAEPNNLGFLKISVDGLPS